MHIEIIQLNHAFHKTQKQMHKAICLTRTLPSVLPCRSFSADTPHTTRTDTELEDNTRTLSAPPELTDTPFPRILQQYHELYELQRRRLEEVVSQLTYDQEMWQQASYDLSLRVAREYDVQTLQRLQLNEKSWSKLAGHFAILLSSKDSQQVRQDG